MTLENTESFDLSFVEDVFKNADEKTKQREKEKGTPIEQIENYLNTMIKNDPKLVKQLIRIYLSAYTNNPINLALLAQSSEGKTYATVEVSKIFPGKDIISVGRMSPTALIHAQGVYITEDGEKIEDKIKELNQEYKERLELCQNQNPCTNLQQCVPFLQSLRALKRF